MQTRIFIFLSKKDLMGNPSRGGWYLCAGGIGEARKTWNNLSPRFQQVILEEARGEFQESYYGDFKFHYLFLLTELPTEAKPEVQSWVTTPENGLGLPPLKPSETIEAYVDAHRDEIWWINVREVQPPDIFKEWEGDFLERRH